MVKTSSMVYKTLIVGVIVLFIGVAIQPAFAVTPKTFEGEDDCDICPKVNKQYLVKLKSLINRLDRYDNILPLLYKYNPKIMEKYQVLSDKITAFQILNEDSPICKILMTILLPVATIIFTLLFLLRDIFYGKPIMSIILTIIYIPIWLIAIGFFSILLLFDCIDLPEP